VYHGRLSIILYGRMPCTQGTPKLHKLFRAFKAHSTSCGQEGSVTPSPSRPCKPLLAHITHSSPCLVPPLLYMVHLSTSTLPPLSTQPNGLL